jgi:phosphoribosylamine--glycine ligase
MALLDRYRKNGFPIFGATKETANWELDRALGQNIFTGAGIEIIPSVNFTSYDKALAYVKDSGGRFVCKPNGEAPKSMSYVSKGIRDLCFMLETWKRNKCPANFVLQEFVPGAEMAVGGWFGPAGWSPWFLENFEHKKLMTGNVGPNTGEMGTIMKYTQQSKLADAVLLPLTGELYRQGYTGYVDVAVIIGKDGTPYPLEFTTRFGYPLWQIQQVLHKEPVEWMLDLVRGQDSFTPRTEVACGIRMCLQDFPYMTDPTLATGFPVYTKGALNNFHPDDMMVGVALDMVGGALQNAPTWISTGQIPLVVSGTGDTVMAAGEAMWKNVSRVEIPSSPLYRIDIGRDMRNSGISGIHDTIKAAQQQGYALDWEL